MKIIDVCSKPCPQPVIETKNAIEAYPQETLKIIIDNEAARVNVIRFAGSKGYKIKEKELGNKKTELQITPFEEETVNKGTDKKTGGTVFFVRSPGLGSSDEQLGKLLIKTFFQTIPDISPLPVSIVFMHGGVKHTVEGSDCLEFVKKLEGLGIDIVVCGTCLDFYGLKEKIKVGRVSNFFEITSILNSAGNTVTL